MFRLSAIMLGLIGAFAIPATALAHAHLKSASPEPMSTVTSAPKEVAIDFTEAVEAQFSAIEVADAQGKRVDDGKNRVDPADAKHLIVGLRPVAAGVYTVTWHATAIDTHKSTGTFTFTVAP